MWTYIYIHTYIYTYMARSLKDLAYAWLNTSNWAGLAADRMAWWRTLNNFGTNGAKLIADACDAAALSASRIAVADTEVARSVALEQVDASTWMSTAAAAAAPPSTAASWEGKRKGGGGVGGWEGGGLSENAYWAHGYMNVQLALRPSHGGWKLRHPHWH